MAKVLYIVNKRIFADSLEQALIKEKKAKVDEIYVDPKFREQNGYKDVPNVGFKTK